MKHSATLSEARARASWPLPEPTLTYFPNARFVPSDRDLDATGRRVASQATRREGVVMADATGDFGHVPVLLDRCFELLRPALTRHHPDGSGAVLIDATLGAGGHAERFLAELPGLRLIGLDRDPTALDIVRGRLSRFADRLTLVHTRYDGIDAALAESGYGTTESVDGMLFDLGVSSMQLDRDRARFLLRPGRAAGHADGPHVTADGGRHRQHLRRGRAGRHPASLRRGAAGPSHRHRTSCGAVHARRSPRPPSW